MTDFTIKGRHVALIFVSAFSIIIAVNLLLAYSAVKTFPGLEVKNSYVASQHFDAERDAQEALGWTVEAKVRGDTLTLSITDADGAVGPEITQATLGRATHVKSDREIDFYFNGQDHVADVSGLESGNWNLRLVARADDGTIFKQRIVLRVQR